MKQIFLTLATVGLIACHNEPEVHIMGVQHDFTQQDTVIVDSLQNVDELLNYLESIPSTHR